MRWRQWVIFAAIIMAVFSFKWVDQAWQLLQIAYLQMQCIAHPIPAGTIVYASGKPPFALVSPQEAALARAYPTRYASKSNQTICTVFADELVANNGLHRLITVEAGVISKPEHVTYATFYWTATNHGLDLAGTNGFISADETAISPGDRAVEPSAREVVIYSAAIDPSDPSHITFSSRVFRYTYHSDGHLMPDGRFRIDTR